MSGPPPARISLSARQRSLLEQIRQRQTAPQRLVRRVLILLALAANPGLRATAADLGLNRISVRLWRDRWRAAAEALTQAEKDNVSDPQLLSLVERVQSRQCQGFCGISGLCSARTPLSSFFKVRCYVSIFDRAAAGPHSASRRVDPDPSAAPRLQALGSPAPGG
jgi:hypothetical protein